jgi:3-deoxy-D-manno-octulosonate 8-phosphate phosphatase (KDO 8-P phosphatase)
MITQELLQKIKKIKLFVTDVDGTLTDGTTYYSSEGEQLKQFSIHDGMGIVLLKKAGIEVAILTSESSPIVEARAKKLKIEHVGLGSRNKKQDLNELAQKLNYSLDEIAYIGDDVNDLQPLEICGLAGCPSDSVAAIKNVADYICELPGGKGAVREFAELILINQNKPITLPEKW